MSYFINEYRKKHICKNEIIVLLKKIKDLDVFLEFTKLKYLIILTKMLVLVSPA